MEGQRIEFKTNVPVRVAFKYPTLREFPSQFEGSGPRFMFTTVNGDVGFVPPIVAQRIAELNVQPREEVDICKGEVKRGQRRSIEWSVMRVAKVQPPAPASQEPPDFPEPPSELYDQLQRSNEIAQQKKQPASHANGAPAASGSATAPSQNGTAPHPQNITVTPKPTVPMKIPYDQAMTHFLIVAGRATRAAEQVLGAEGGSVRFDSRDVAALATTLMIHAAGNIRDRESWLKWDGWNPDGGER